MIIFNRTGGRLVIGLALIALLLQGVARADGNDGNKRIFIFGDSLSDPGNVHLLLQQFGFPAVTEAPYGFEDLIPSAPYNFQGFQFSNGRTWAQRFAKKLGTKRSGKPALKKPGKFTNYAYGGATARFEGNLRSGPEQLSQYMADFPGPADSNALYVIQFGGNDIRAALDSPPSAEAIVGMAVASEVQMILDLYQKGARNFLVANVPDLSLTPAIMLADVTSGLPPGTVTGAANELVLGYNSGLENALAGLEVQFDDISIKRLNIFGILNDIVANPDKYGIEDTVNTCINYGAPAEFAVCDKPKTFVFWDGIHPTKKVHRIVARIAAGLYADNDDDDGKDKGKNKDD